MVALWRGVRRERELARLKSDFVSTVSHELKTPLTSIRMFGEMLREGVGQGDAERERRYHEVIVRESERLGRLIANVLDFAQIEKGARTYDRRAVSAPMLAGEAVDTFRRLADGEGQEIALAVLPQAGSAQVLADREAIVQALLNLLSNAAKYGARRPVSVSVGADAENVRIAVADHGPGLASGEQERVFREFYRAPEARRSGVEGTGLGLALVKRHVEAHGGRIEVESAPGQGATFTIVLPRAMEQVA
jgi:two-component system phosphate regulon sensor histidine kinase PhoR